jgi:putative peptidoglycan lipid II flippase
MLIAGRNGTNFTLMNQQLLKSTTKVSLMTLISRIMGFIRDMVCANAFGASAGFDAFLLAFKIPNFWRRLFAEGAFSQAFVPILADYKATQSPQTVKQLVNRVSGNLTLILLLMVGLGCLGAPLWIKAFAPGFIEDAMRFELATTMLRITFPYLLLISLTALAGGILNAYGHFAIPAFTPVLLNLSLIVMALGLSPYLTEPVIALAWGVLLGGVVQLLFQWPFLKKINMVPRWQLHWQDPGVKRIMALMLPAVIGASVMQVNLLVDTLFASFLPPGSLSWLYYAERLLEFPLGIFGVALATVILPHLATYYAQGAHRAFSNSLDRALRWILIISLPATLGLGLLAQPIISTLFQHGAFAAQDVRLTSYSLMALSLGLGFFMSAKILVSAFYARQNTQLPLKVALLAMLSNVLLNALFIGPLAHAGLSLASSLASAINALLLLGLLLQKNIYQPQSGWGAFSARLGLANMVLAGWLWGVTPQQIDWFDYARSQQVLTLSGLILSSMLIYVIILWLSGWRYRQMVVENG